MNWKYCCYIIQNISKIFFSLHFTENFPMIYYKRINLSRQYLHKASVFSKVVFSLKQVSQQLCIEPWYKKFVKDGKNTNKPILGAFPQKSFSHRIYLKISIHKFLTDIFPKFPYKVSQLKKELQVTILFSPSGRP